MRGSKWKEGLTWDDLPAILLTGVSALTVTTGAQLLRGQSPMLMLALGAGVAGSTFVLDRLLVERLNAIRARQSVAALLACWLPMFLFATALATLATFSWIAPEIVRRDLDDGKRQHWSGETEKISTYLVALTTALRRQADSTVAEIDAERRRAANARREGTPYAPDALRVLQRKLTAVRDLERKLPNVKRAPSEAPAGDAAIAQLDAAYREIQDVHASAALLLAAAPALPQAQPFIAPATDLQSVVMEETRKRTWRALTAWGAALWVEVLPLLALWRGGRKVPLAARVLQWRSRVKDTVDAVRGHHAAAALPIVIEPLHVRGIVRIAVPADYTLSDCTPLLEEAVDTLTGVLGSYELRAISNARGDNVDDAIPLLPQLNGEPLVLSVEESRS
jgi:uncharacterized protein YdbL (DUF1318 family)